jgi:TetR/AcrR family tetracycline transcriptional repressor
MSPRPRGGRLTEERIVDAALRVIDAEGLDALSMRRLGGELRVDPMAVYHHVANKDALLRAVVTRVFHDMPAPRDTGPWQRRVRQWADAYLSIARAHPNLVLRIVTDPAAVAVAAVWVNEALYRALERSGLRAADVARAADTLVDFVNGHVLGLATAEVHAAAGEALRAELDARSPDQVGAQRRALSGTAGAGSGRDSFAFGLDALLAGFERLAPSP